MDKLKTVRRVLWVTLSLNLLSTVFKLIVGILTGTLSLIAAGMDSGFDSLSNIIGLVGVSMAARPADEEHPYGHQKAETLTTFLIAIFLFLSAWELGKGAVENLLHPELITAEVNLWSFGVIILSIVINQAIVMYELRVGRKVRSDVLIADASNKRADVIMSISLLVGLLLIRAGFALADPILALLVSLFIVKAGVEIVQENSPTLMDRIAIPEEELRRIACNVPGVLTCHRVRSRGHGDAVYIDMHIQVDPQIGIEQAHALSHRVQDRLRGQYSSIADVTVHAEPAETVDRSVDEDALMQGIRAIAEKLSMHVHDVRLFQNAGVEHVSLHAEIEDQSSLHEAHAQVTELEGKIKLAFPSVAEVVVRIEPCSPDDGVLMLSSEDLIARIQKVTEHIVGVGHTHKIKVQPYGKGWYTTLHCTLPDDTSLEDANITGSMVEHTLYASIPQLELVVVHTEPESDTV